MPASVAVASLDAVPCPNPPGMTTGSEVDVSVPPTVIVAVTGAVTVIEVVPPPARTSVVDMRSTYKLYDSMEQPKL